MFRHHWNPSILEWLRTTNPITNSTTETREAGDCVEANKPQGRPVRHHILLRYSVGDSTRQQSDTHKDFAAPRLRNNYHPCLRFIRHRELRRHERHSVRRTR